MKEFRIGPNEAGQRLDKFLGKYLRGASTGFLYKMLRKKNITVNDRKQSGAEKLSEGDIVRFWFSDESFAKLQGSVEERLACVLPPVSSDFRRNILYEDEGILILDKPAGMLSQKAAAGDISANELLLTYLMEQGSVTEESLRSFRPAIANRLDRNTSGLLLAGKTLPALQTLSACLRERSVEKYYLACVKGRMRKAQEVRAFLSKNSATNQVTVRSVPEGPEDRAIRTAFVPLAEAEDCTLLLIHLITGRTHQIRAQLSALGHPLLGDPKYGDTALNRRIAAEHGIRRQLLHAYILRFPRCAGVLAGLSGKTLRSPWPEDFKSVFPETEFHLKEVTLGNLENKRAPGLRSRGASESLK